MVTLQNKSAEILLNPEGAELTRFFSKPLQIEYIWEGDPAFWGKHSPVLFPIVGTLKNNSYIYQGKKYSMGRHGFARDHLFIIEEQQEESVTFLFRGNEETHIHYPFSFNLRIRYTLQDNKLRVKYLVSNSGRGLMYFSIGAHPAFRVPLEKGLSYDDYYLLFEKIEESARWPISSDGLIESNPLPLLEHSNRLPLSKALFYEDALVFKNIRSTQIDIRSDRSPHGLSVGYEGFPYLGIWAAKEADFVCIEPWCGIADAVDSDQEFERKEGIVALAPQSEWEKEWSITIF